MKEPRKEYIVDRTMEWAGMPDPETHRPCRVCRQWLPKEEAGEQMPEPLAINDITSTFLAFGRLASGHRPGVVFVCSVCRSRRRRIKNALWLLMLVLVGSIMVLDLLGFLK